MAWQHKECRDHDYHRATFGFNECFTALFRFSFFDFCSGTRKWQNFLDSLQDNRCLAVLAWNLVINICVSKFEPSRLFYAWDAISFTTMAAGPVSIHFVCGETRRPAGNCFATPVLVGRDATAAIVVNEMRETAVTILFGGRTNIL